MAQQTGAVISILKAVAIAALAIIFTGCAKIGQSRFFSDQAYHFQTLRALNDISALVAVFAAAIVTVVWGP